MGQYYVFANVTKCQKMEPRMFSKACSILGSGDFQHWLALFLLDLGTQTHEESLQNTCLKFLCNTEQLYPSSVLEQLPKPILKKMDKMFLAQGLVGKWAKDRLIITGDYSDYFPFPPDGQWKHGNLYERVNSDFSFSDMEECHDYYHSHKETLIKKLQRLYKDQLHVIGNLDKKEYLDPRAFNQMNVADFIETNGGVTAGLVLTLIHSTGCGGGDLKPTEALGSWAGDRIVIRSPEQFEDWKTYSNITEEVVFGLEVE